MTHLQKLGLSGAYVYRYLTPLAKLTDLLYLECCRMPIKDVTVLSNLSNLRFLSLNGCKKLTDLQCLAGLVKLKQLILTDLENVSDFFFCWLITLQWKI